MAGVDATEALAVATHKFGVVLHVELVEIIGVVRIVIFQSRFTCRLALLMEGILACYN